MKGTLMGYEDWTPFVPASYVGLHHKLVTNAGMMSHFLYRFEIIDGDEEKKDELNDVINGNTQYLAFGYWRYVNSW